MGGGTKDGVLAAVDWGAAGRAEKLALRDIITCQIGIELMK
jgi:hypothetical protein